MSVETIGLKLLREAKEKLAGAYAAIREEMTNPDLAEDTKQAVMTIGEEIDEHLSNLGELISSKPAGEAPESVPADGLPTEADLDKVAEEESVRDATGDSATYPDGRPANDGASDGNSIYDPAPDQLPEAPEPQGETVGEKIGEALGEAFESR